ncbi:hypothetical protein AS156_06460 [Bradyrhizobium macuxiense]|uniref:DUF2934 family protein n=1 Tax=Bradyrhizobium macuxiense TaxID=1755647 RepID=A0A109JT19_9BRAD|nr:hypothetical protein AS156_06460 [Bradyrhizobium macuxiense]
MHYLPLQLLRVIGCYSRPPGCDLDFWLRAERELADDETIDWLLSPEPITASLQVCRCRWGAVQPGMAEAEFLAQQLRPRPRSHLPRDWCL